MTKHENGHQIKTLFKNVKEIKILINNGVPNFPTLNGSKDRNTWLGGAAELWCVEDPPASAAPWAAARSHVWI